MHCHLMFHSEVGMMAALHVGRPDDVPPVPKGFPTCGSFVPTVQHTQTHTHSVNTATSLLRPVTTWWWGKQVLVLE